MPLFFPSNPTKRWMRRKFWEARRATDQWDRRPGNHRGRSKRVHSLKRLFIITAAVLGACMADDDRLRDDTPCAELAFQACDVFQPECQARVYRFDECARQYLGQGFPEVTQIQQEQYRQRLQSDLQNNADADPERARIDRISTTSLSLLNLVPTELQSVDQADIDQQAATTLAFYSLADKNVTLIDHGTPLNDTDTIRENTIVLGHEFVHAQQDEQYDLLQFYSRHFDESSDGYYAWRSIVEGEASFVEVLIEAVDIHTTIDPVKLQAYLQKIESIQRQSALKLNAPFTSSLRYFPYRFGFSYMARAYIENSLAGLHFQYQLPPTSVVDFLHNPLGPRIARRDLQWFEDPQDNGPQAVVDRLGAWALFSLLGRNGIAETRAFEIAKHWRGDSWYAQGDAQGLNVGVMWRIALDTSQQTMLPTLAQELAQNMKAADGESPTKIAIWAENDELMIVAAQQPDQLQSWRQKAESMKHPPRTMARNAPVWRPLPRHFFEHLVPPESGPLQAGIWRD